MVSLTLYLGADDIEQLKELDNEEFEQLCGMIGMDKKPFHVLRLKKALNKHTAAATKPHPTEAKTTPMMHVQTTPTMLIPAHAQPSSSNSPTASLSSLSLKSSSSIKDPIPRIGTEQNHLPPSKAFLNAMEKSDSSLPSADATRGSSSSAMSLGSANIIMDGSITIPFLPPYLQEDSDSRNFDELIDDQTPIQKTLGACPCLPSTWNPERRELIRKYANIYGKNFNKRHKELLTPFEEQVNEGAYQLCLRDPTLLVRREELFVLAKRAVKEGGYAYYHGYSKSKDIENTIATTGQKRAHPGESSSHMVIPASKILITSDFNGAMPKKMSGRMRQEKMVELERMIAMNKSQQAAKLVELEKAQQLCNFSSAFSIQLEVESLGTACQQLQSSYAALKRKQRRSDRYYTLKEREADDEVRTASKGEGSQEVVSPTAPMINRNNELSDRIFFTTQQQQQGSSSDKELPSKSRPSAVTATVIPASQGGAPVSTSRGGPANRLNSSSEGEDREVQDLVENVSHATNEVNSLMIRNSRNS